MFCNIHSEVIYMSEIIEAFTDMVKVIADNPASILIVLGFMGVLIAVLFPIGIGAQLLIGGTGSLMLVIGIIVHVAWLER
jgi:hypothetical protein